MPGAIGALIAKALVAIGVNAAVATFVGNVVGVVLLSTLTSKLFGPRLPEGPGFSGLQVTARSALEYRKIIYGQAMVSGPIAYTNMSGTDNSDYWVQVAMVHGRCEDIVSCWLDGIEIPKANIAWTAGSGSSDGTGTGNVSNTELIGESSTNAVKIYYYLGYDDQPVNAALNTAFSDITTNHRCRGISHVIYRMIYNENTAKVWEGGPPAQFRAVWKGRLLYDPRKDTSKGGTGSHDFDDDSTWEYSDNPALCVADYLTQIMDVAEDSIDWDSVADAADDCDETVAIPTSDTEKRFTCNGALSLGNSHRENLDAILSSMDGKLTYAGGKWKVRASMWEASSVSFDEDDHAGDLNGRGSAPKAERWNTVRGYFSDPERKYEFVEFEPVTDSTYVSRDGGKVIERELDLPMTNSETMAQRIAYRVLHQGNNQIVINPTFNFRGRKATVGDVVSLTDSELSWSSETFRVINWTLNEDGSTGLVLREDHEDDYDDPDEEEYQSKTIPTTTTPGPTVPAPSSLSATATPVGIRLDWTNPAGKLWHAIEVWVSTDNSWANAVKVAETTSNSFTMVRDAGDERWFWVRAKRANGRVSKRSPDSDTSTVTATSGDIGTGDLEDDAVTDSQVTDDPADGDIDYAVASQPAIEDAGINGAVEYTSPTGVTTKATISWSGQAQISNLTSGTAVGYARILITIRVNSVSVFSKELRLEAFTDDNDWGVFSGTRTVSVPGGQKVEAFLTVGRKFSTSGASPAQTITWRDCWLNLVPIKK